MATQVIEVCLDVRGHLGGTMASKTTKMAVRGYMHMNIEELLPGDARSAE